MDAPVENPWTNGSSYKINGKDEEYSSKRLSLVYCAKFETQQNQAAQEHWITELKRSESKEFDLTEDEVLLLSQYRIEDANDKRWINLVFSIENGLWPLPYILRCIMNENGQIKHLETRPSKKENYSFDVLVKVELSKNELMNVIKFVRSNHGIYLHGIPREELVLKEIWFPKHISDLDKCTHVLSHLEPDLESDHPGFNDVIYRTRRQEIADISSKYKYGHVVPAIKYTEDEIKTWGIVFKKMRKLHSKYACSQYRKCFRMLEEELNFNPDCIPQMQDISMFLKRKTGFTLRPASGLVTARDFLASLAFRVFQCTQYVRHSCKPDHSPEPDCIHEYLGHVPMFADPVFAKFSQEIGLASLGASDENIEKLSTIYFYTIEFGLCKENNSIKAYGAGLLSSYGELQNAISGKPKIRPFEPEITAITPYNDSTYLETYFVADSFEEAKDKIRDFVDSHFRRPYDFIYDPYTDSIVKLDSFELIQNVADTMKSQLSSLNYAVKCLQKYKT